MGLGLSKPQRPVPAYVLAISAPSLYLRLLKVITSQVKNPAFVGAGLKAYGVPLFTMGHLLQAFKKKDGPDFPDWSYIIGCIWLNLGFIGAYKGKPFPEGILASGLTLFGFGLPLCQRALKAGVSTTLPVFATLAAVVLTWLGGLLLGLQNGIIKKAPPGLTPAQYGQLASALFAAANYTKLLQLIQAGGPADTVWTGQVMKVTASSLLLTGNGLGLGWQGAQLPAEQVLNAAAAVSTAALMVPRMAS